MAGALLQIKKRIWGYIAKSYSDTITYINEKLALKQNKLTVGTGIKIENDVISTTLDTKVVEFSATLPAYADAKEIIYVLTNDYTAGAKTYYKKHQYVINSSKTDYNDLGEISFDSDAYYTKSNTYTKAEVDALLTTEQTTRANTDTSLQTSINAKQDKLISGTNIKTINETPLLGSGDIGIHLYEHNIATDICNMNLRIYTTSEAGMDASALLNWFKARPDVKINVNGAAYISGDMTKGGVVVFYAMYSSSKDSFFINGAMNVLNTSKTGYYTNRSMSTGFTYTTENFLKASVTDKVVKIF